MCKIIKNISNNMHAWRRLAPQSSYDGRTCNWNLDAWTQQYKGPRKMKKVMCSN
jgi:hypothetical protein